MAAKTQSPIRQQLQFFSPTKTMSDYEDDYGGYSSPQDYGGYSSPQDYGGYSSGEDYGSRHAEIDQDEGNHAMLPSLEVVEPHSRSNIGSYESEKTSKFHYKDYEDGKNYSAKRTGSYKARDFVEKRTGNPGFKEEAKHTSYYKVDDKIGGSKTEYETQVKITKKVTITNPNSSVSTIDKISSSYADPTVSSNFKNLIIK